MIVHAILFKPREDLDVKTRRDLLEALRHAAVGIPSVRRIRVGRRVRHGLPGYEQAMTQDFAFAVFVEVDDVAGLTAYLTHPAHAELGRHFTASSAAALAYDYDVVEGEEIAGLQADLV